MEKDALIHIDSKFVSEKEIIKAVPSKLRLGFPETFRHLAKFGRKLGMRGKPTYFYTQVKDF